MNNELIERIDAVFANRYRENNVVMGMASVPSVDYESLWLLLWDCKIALTQQQEAEPVAWMAINKERPERVHFSSHQTYMENLAAYPGSTEFWDDTTLYLRPPKPAAQQQEAEPVAWILTGTDRDLVPRRYMLFSEREAELHVAQNLAGGEWQSCDAKPLFLHPPRPAALPVCNCPGAGKSGASRHAPNCPVRKAAHPQVLEGMIQVSIDLLDALDNKVRACNRTEHHHAKEILAEEAVEALDYMLSAAKEES